LNRAKRYKQLIKLSNGPLHSLTILYARQFLADYPDHGVGWMRLGIALVELARYEEAEQALAKSIEHCPKNKQQYPFAQMGHLFQFAGDYDQSIKWHRKSVKADPKDATYRIFLGGVLAKQGRLREAEKVYRSATSCAEGCIDEAYLNLGTMLRAQERFHEAADCLREAIRLDPKYRPAQRALRDVERCIKLTSRRTKSDAAGDDVE
jgi:tetratricopeptide (TPR) repeat protein